MPQIAIVFGKFRFCFGEHCVAATAPLSHAFFPYYLLGNLVPENKMKVVELAHMGKGGDRVGIVGDEDERGGAIPYVR